MKLNLDLSRNLKNRIQIFAIVNQSINHQSEEIFHGILGFGYTMRIFFLLTEEGLKFFWIGDSQNLDQSLAIFTVGEKI